MERTAVTGPVLDERTGRVVGVTAKPVDDRGRKVGDDETYTAPVVVACDGVSARLAIALGLERRENRPMARRGAAPTTRPRATTTSGWSPGSSCGTASPDQSNLLPGYGWIFGVGDGTANVGLGILNTSKAFQHVDYKDVLRRWLANTARRVGLPRREPRRPDRLGRAADGLQPQAALHPRRAAGR